MLRIVCAVTHVVPTMSVIGTVVMDALFNELCYRFTLCATPCHSHTHNQYQKNGTTCTCTSSSCQIKLTQRKRYTIHMSIVCAFGFDTFQCTRAYILTLNYFPNTVWNKRHVELKVELNTIFFCDRTLPT